MFDNTTYLYACEHNNSFEYIFNITDLDNDTSPSLAIVPQNPFYVQSLGQLYSGVFYGRIYTLGFTLDQSDVGTYSETITVTDSDSSSDAEDVTIEVLDINKVPSIEDLGVRMIWNTGDNATFYYEWDANDVDEDGTLHDGIMNISLSYQNGSAFTLFTINATGVMNFTADNTTALATHNLMICVNDSALLSPHENLSTHCGTTGSANTICDTFSLTITDSNRAPVIRSSYPTNTSFSADADDTLTFRVYAYDADDNPIDYDWYVDGSFIERTSFNASANYTYSDDFTYAFPCGVTGIHTVSVNVTDGSAYDNVTWFVTVSSDSCDSSSGSSGGGGGDFTPFCSQQWLCPHWNTCVNALSYFTSGLLDIFVYNSYLDQCQQLGYNAVSYTHLTLPTK